MIRVCPKCGAYSADESLAFCLADGTPLISVAPDNERWNEAVRALEEKSRTERKQHRKLIWRRVVVTALTASMLALALSKSFVVETIPNGTIPPTLTEVPTSSSSSFPPELVALLSSPSPSPSASPLLSPSPSPAISPSPSQATVTPLVYKISGRVTDAGQSIAGVKIRLEGSKATLTTTDGNGYYAFDELRADGSYTVTPVKARTNFTPFNRSFDHLTQDGWADFTGFSDSPPPTVVYKITGRVTSAGRPVGGIKIRLEGSKATSTTTDGNGYYVFNDLRAGGSYTITPVKDRINFTPLNHPFNNLTQDGSADFAGPGQDDTKPPSKCTDADESRERNNIKAMQARWVENISSEGERLKVTAANLRQGETAEATLVSFESQIGIEECKVAYVTLRYQWRLDIFFNSRPARVLNVPGQRRFVCGKALGGWFCKSI
ncbi:MAG TPA: carboxypeptidase regulatory-like domain-containing protein [Pyrinomonadaceae bacterium]